MAMTSVVASELPDSREPPVSDYQRLRGELDMMKVGMDGVRMALGQIGALMHAVKLGGRSEDLIELAHYVADEWSESANHYRKRAEVALNTTPEDKPHRMRWANCSCPECALGAEGDEQGGFLLDSHASGAPGLGGRYEGKVVSFINLFAGQEGDC